MKRARRRSWAQMGEVERGAVRARQAVSRALASGKLVRPKECPLERPLNKYHSTRIEAHHYKGDWSKEYWLDVIFMCHRCHSRIGQERLGKKEIECLLLEQEKRSCRYNASSKGKTDLRALVRLLSSLTGKSYSQIFSKMWRSGIYTYDDFQAQLADLQAVMLNDPDEKERRLK